MRMLSTPAIVFGVALICCGGAAAMPAGTAMKQAAAAASMVQMVQRGRIWTDRIDRARSDADTSRQTGHHRRKHSKGKH